MLGIVLNTPRMVDFNLAFDFCHCSHFTDELMLMGLILDIFRVLEIPLTPIILTIPFTDVYSDSIKVKWAPRYDGRSAIRAYNLEYKKEKDVWRQYQYGIPPVNNIPSDINELEVNRLEPGQGYQFRIRAVNDVGASVWSEYSEMRRTKARGRLVLPPPIQNSCQWSL